MINTGSQSFCQRQRRSSYTSTPRVLQISVPKPIGRCPASRTRAVAVAAQRIDIKPFSGCNCFYLLTNSRIVEGNDEGRKLVLRTLDQIKEVGFTVIRTWAYQDDPERGDALQYKGSSGEMVYDQSMLDGLTWLMNACKDRGLQLMLCLTNGNHKEYGGMRQYVRWSKGIPQNQEVSNGEFFNDPEAQKLYKNYVEFMITKYKGHPAVHSWDLANEPRCQGDVSCGKMNAWIASTAAFVKTLDHEHPLTVGLDGFFGISTPELCRDGTYNPYWGEDDSRGHWPIEGCDFAGNFKSPHLDFASIHLYPFDSVGPGWNIADTPENHRIDWSVKWINDHIKVCKDHLNNIPLVLQEYNLPANDAHEGRQRRDFHRAIAELLWKQITTDNEPPILKGSMVWCMADPTQAKDPERSRQYYMYARSVSNNSSNIHQANDSQVEVLEDLSRKIQNIYPAST